MRIRTPLIELSKAEIIRRGTALGVDFGATVSCYQADAAGRACGRCDSCRLRRGASPPPDCLTRPATSDARGPIRYHSRPLRAGR